MIRNTILFLLALVFGLGCNLNSSAVNDIVIDVDDDFQLTFRENLESSVDDLIFFLESINNRECEADTLLIRIDDFATAIRLDIDVVNSTGACIPGSNPSKTQATSAALRNDRVALSVKLEGLVDNQGNVLKSDRDFKVQMETTHGFYLPYETLNRVPRSSIWGYIGFTPSYREEAQHFFNRFEAITEKMEADVGQYGYFSVNKEQEVRVEGQEDVLMYTQAFLRSFDVANDKEIKGLFEEYREKYPTMKFFYYNSFGEKFE